VASVAAGALGLAGFARLYRDQGQRRVLGVALLTHAVAAVLAAASFWPEGYGNFFSLALVPLALLWSRALTLGPLAGRATIATAAAAATLASALGTWNATESVEPSLDRSHVREVAADRIENGVPSGSRVLVSAQLAPLLAYRDVDAATGWAALEWSLGEEGPRARLEQLAADETRSLVVSSRAFVLSDSQAAYLRTTEGEVWSILRSCCAPRPLFTVSTDAGPETAYLLRSPSQPSV
jgi:hypothetical protein